MLLRGVAIVALVIEREADFTLRSLGCERESKALILYHPSRDAHFTDDLALAVARYSPRAGE